MSKFKLKDTIDRLIYRGFNILSELLFYIKRNERALVAKNVQYKRKHRGEKFFILGNGPSLNTLNHKHYQYISKHISFAVNLFYKNDKFPEFEPTYYAMVDPLSITKAYESMYTEFNDKYKNSILIADYRAKELVDKLDRRNRSIFLYSKKFPTDHIGCDISSNSFITMNVVSTCILTAIFMGAKEIYLLGTDYNSFASRSDVHFYKEEEGLNRKIENRLGYQLKYYHITTEFHYLIAKLAKEKGVKIVNLCETSLLDAYPLGRFDDLMNNIIPNE